MSACSGWIRRGMIVQGTTTQRILEVGEDPSGLGRWCWTKLHGIAGSVIRIISIYIPNDSPGEESVAAQHRRYYDKRRIEGDVVDLLWNDLKISMAEWYDIGEMLLVAGDFNQDIKDDDISEFFQEFDMREVLTGSHENTPETYKCNSIGLYGQ